MFRLPPWHGNDLTIFRVARQLTTKLVASSYTVHSIIRKDSQVSELEALGAKPIVQSIEDASVDDITATIKKYGPNVVVWSAGAGGGNPERTKTVDHEGAVKVFDATAAAGVKRFIIVSAVDIRDRENKPAPEWYTYSLLSRIFVLVEHAQTDPSDIENRYNEEDTNVSNRMWGAIGAYCQAKLSADRDLVTKNGQRKLDYTIVRPGSLNTDKGSGTVAAGKVHLGKSISREDVAEVIVECIKEPSTIGLAFDVVGGDTPIADAVREVGTSKVDTFEGHY